MNQNESNILVSMSDTRPISPSLVIETTVAAQQATVDVKRKRERPRNNDVKPSEESSFSTRSLRRSNKGDMSMSRGGGDFTLHIFTINKGEDIVKTIMSFTQSGSRGISVLSANGAVSKLKIRPLGLPDVLKFKDAYEIVSLSSSIVITENGRVKNKTKGWRITIGGAGGCVFGGSLASRLIAASPVQVVIGSFWPLLTNPPKRRRKSESEAVVVSPTTPNALASSSTGQVQAQKTIAPSLNLELSISEPDLEH